MGMAFMLGNEKQVLYWNTHYAPYKESNIKGKAAV